MSTTSNTSKTSGGTVRVLVVGATGQQGSAVVEALKEKRLKNRYNEKIEIYAVSRDVNSKKSEELRAQDVKMVEGDISKVESFAKILENIKPDRIFFVTTPYIKGGSVSKEQQDGFAVVDAITKYCKTNTGNKPYVVFSSVGDAERLKDIPHFGSKFEIEKYLKKNSQNNTLYDYYVIRPVFFMDNFKNFSRPAYGKFSGLLQPDTKMKMISTYDIGRAVATCMENPKDYKDGILELAADDKTMNEAAIIFSRVWNTNVQYKRIPWFQMFLVNIFVHEIAYMTRRLEEAQYCEEAMLASKKLNLNLLTLKEWTKREFKTNDDFYKKKSNTWLYSVIGITLIGGLGYYYYYYKK